MPVHYFFERINEMTLKMTENLRQKLDRLGIECYDISGRPKHLYGIYRKMYLKQKEFHEVYDISGLRIIVEKREDCYRTLAIVHDSYRPIPGRFKSSSYFDGKFELYSLTTIFAHLCIFTILL